MRVLLIEDDENLSAVIEEQLQKEGYITNRCADGETALSYALNLEYGHDIVLLDRMLPIIDGLTILKAMRRKQIYTPVLMMTGLGELDDKIDGLDCGADDYLVKPFHMKELLARVRALTRRPTDIVDKEVLTAYDLTLDAGQRRLTCNGYSIILTQKEADVMTVFLESPDKMQTRDGLLWKVWGGRGEVEDGNIDNYIHFLRKRLRELGCKTTIKTVYGAGYRLEESP
ncbi:response regulator transcription factor [Lutispora saccharofermentans]|uniref:Stage 0 sporulation protein A homolog n=1 Tax=Lutispora saccharofermentans TaxID=3024236 RepID=A0ABT1NH05_9FIRM|nr:response regulator transcription factor [Lutispora saccharofermentans]MCQ1530540.1 response regulator transcription factor [Lutispora saccharofermentans]